MIESTNNFKTTPLGSLRNLSEGERLPYLEKFYSLPPSLRDFLSSLEAGAYIQGVAKQFNLENQIAPQIAFIVLQICIGERPMKDMAQVFQTELGIPNTTAQLMAQDFEKELFAPISVDLNTYLTQKKEPPRNSSALPPNTLDLKNRNVTSNQ